PCRKYHLCSCVFIRGHFIPPHHPQNLPLHRRKLRDHLRIPRQRLQHRRQMLPRIHDHLVRRRQFILPLPRILPLPPPQPSHQPRHPKLRIIPNIPTRPPPPPP